ncbi:MAG: LacI family DNA-binding transcriptional regulator [Austwickia sp.]|jgi:LacI family transcriptional regulator|nr:LacI family DNA-binding transcriptional regulator [Austwickia sp.]MBK8435357.1 LacI family DNA-binding transcriptional regulator [Austwickia sp.]MBK9101095.1 LacI family DNA-binding transcriptional regulator [Austwickia sp.]
MDRPPRMRDVAERAGVSVATVSRVVNEKTVDAELRRRVEAAIEEVGYRPNSAARSLRRGHDNVIGVIVDDLANPFIGQVITAIEQLARQQDLFLLAGSAGPGRDEAVVRAMAERHVAGILLVPSDPDQSYLESISASTPVVVLDRLYDGMTELGIDSVTVDNYEGGAMAARALTAHGHRDVMFVGCDSGLPTVGERFRGFVAGLAEAGIDLPSERVCWVGRDPGIGTVADAVVDAIDGRPHPSAVFASAARTTNGLMHSWHRIGCPPMGLIGFDDTTLSRLPWRPLTVVNQDPRAMGEMATQVLLDRLATPGVPAQHRQIPLALIDRGSANGFAGAATGDQH